MTSISPPMVGRYQLLGPLGKGGQGEVYEAHDTYENCRVALKLFAHRSPHPGGPWIEAVILRHLNDPHILPIRNADQHLGRPYLVTEVAEHGTVQDRLDAAGSCGLPVDDVVRWIRQACYGAARAHDVGLVHNDIKPGNLFLNAESECLVGDFGYAGKIDTSSGLAEVYGASKETMAPEVAAGWATTAPTGSIASDVYSLGASAVWMLAGRTLHDFAGHVGLAAELSVVANVVPPRIRDLAPHVPVAVATAVERATARIPSDRYRTAIEFAAALAAREEVRRGDGHGRISTSPASRVGAERPIIRAHTLSASIKAARQRASLSRRSTKAPGGESAGGQPRQRPQPGPEPCAASCATCNSAHGGNSVTAVDTGPEYSSRTATLPNFAATWPDVARRT